MIISVSAGISSVLAFLSLTNLILLGLGLINPSMVKMESRKSVIKKLGLSFFVLFFLLCLAAPSSSNSVSPAATNDGTNQNSVNQSQPQNNQTNTASSDQPSATPNAEATGSNNNQQASIEPSKPEEQKPVSKEILVTNQVVKMVDGKCRYFFFIENKDQSAFSGSVTIKVINPITTVGTDTFTTKQPIEPSMSQIVYIDTNTCPPSIHGEAGTNKFEYEVKENNQTVKTGSGGIIDKITE
jgi:hypothetical protein